MHKKGFWTLIMITLILGIIFWNVGGSRITDIAPYYLKKLLGETATVTYGNTTYALEVASTPSAQMKGLSGRAYLPADKGMVFVFPEKAVYQFTMMDTNVTLDIIWIEDDTIVHIAKRAQPGVEVIMPSAKANYVIELKAGSARSWGVGDTVEISFDKE